MLFVKFQKCKRILKMTRAKVEMPFPAFNSSGSNQFLRESHTLHQVCLVQLVTIAGREMYGSLTVLCME